jgi:hypothetical protein
VGSKAPGGLAVIKTLICLVKNPYRHIIRRWNWKTACLSAFSRSAAILMANLSAGGSGAVSAMATEICYRSLTSGFLGAVTQSFRYTKPAWAASIVSIVLIPAIADTFELITHVICGTQRLGATVATSVIFTVISALLELFAMRRGVLVVGHNRGSLLQDIRKMPELVFALRNEVLGLLVAFSASVRKSLVWIHSFHF